MIIDPRPMTMQSWVNAVTFSLRKYGLIPQLNGDDWRGWVRNLTLVRGMTRFQLPDTEPFLDWKEWAIRFNSTVEY